MERDYILRHAKEVRKILALLLGLMKKGAFPEVLEIIQQTLQQTFGLKDDFEINDLLEMVAQKQLAVTDLKTIASFLIQKGHVYQQIGDELLAHNCYEKAITLLEAFQAKTPIYDLAVQKMIRDLKKGTV
jgi:tetratricopeptide (TPR) repeat protein